MQSKTALSLYLLAMAGPASILAQDEVTVWDSATVVVTVTAGSGASPAAVVNNNPPVEEKVAEPAPSPPPSSTPTSNPPPPPTTGSAPASSSGSSGPSGNLQSSGGQICVNFSGNDNFHFLNTGSWGSNSGYGTQSASQRGHVYLRERMPGLRRLRRSQIHETRVHAWRRIPELRHQSRRRVQSAPVLHDPWRPTL